MARRNQPAELPSKRKHGGVLSLLAFPFVWLSGAIWGVHHAFNRLFERLRSAYTGLLGRALDRPWLTAGAMLVFALASLVLFPNLGQDFFPAVDAGWSWSCTSRPGRQQPRIDIAGAPPRPGGGRDSPGRARRRALHDPRQHGADAIVYHHGLRGQRHGQRLRRRDPRLAQAEPPPDRGLRRPAAERPAEALPRLHVLLHAGRHHQARSSTSACPRPIDVQVVGVDRPGDLAVASPRQEQIAKLSGLADVHVHQITDRRDRVRGRGPHRGGQLGPGRRPTWPTDVLVSLSSTSRGLATNWPGSTRTKRQLPTRPPRQTPDWHKVDSIEALQNTPIIVGPAQPTGAGANAATSAVMNTPNPAVQLQPQLLSNLTNLRRTTSEQNINHYNVQPVYEVYANVQGRDLGTASADIQKIVDSLKAELPRGSTIAVRGQVQSMNNSFIGLAGGLAFAVLLVYFLMVVNFQSWLDPFIILTALPGALAGIVWMLFVSQTTISVPALMGAMMCVGVATSNSILLVTFANDERRAAQGRLQPSLSAGTTRLRPVLMTALAMIIGMLPMSLGLGEGGEENAPLGRAVIGGLLVATMFTLVPVPVMYRLLRATGPAAEAE